jgi:Animal haem peroxidase
MEPRNRPKEAVVTRTAGGAARRNGAGPDEVHAAESIFVLGEGLLSESAGGRRAAAADEPARTRASDDDPPFRFRRIGPKGKQLPEATLRKLADEMTEPGGGGTGIPAGYTYLGQFIDHDLTMDRTTKMLGASVAPADMIQGRSPSLDLDSLYGAGPNDPGSEKFYAADGLKLKMGRTDDNKPFDLPRDGNKVLIPDHRNDENLAVGQTHLAFIRFHNRVIKELSSVPQAKRFAKARRAVVKHYQWMIRHDYLPRICEPSVVDDVFANGRKLFEPQAGTSRATSMPIEFSVAAFRLGHSMIRGEYQWNAIFQDGGGTLVALFSFSGTGGNLSENSPLPGIWPADWRRLFDFPAAGHAGLAAPPGRFNRAMRIDTRVVNPLGKLPLGALGLKKKPKDKLELNLAFRNLMRGRMVKLATGQDMVARLKSKGVNVKALTKPQIVNGNGGAELSSLTVAQRNAVAANTPLWFYVLREAELNDGKLDGVGARIVAETFHRAIAGSKASIIRHEDFVPHFAADDNTFNMPDLLFFAFEGKKQLLNPVK